MFTKRLTAPSPSKIRCSNCFPYRFATTSKSSRRVPSKSIWLSRSPRVATAIGEARTSLPMVDSSEECVDRGGRGRDGSEGWERVPPYGRGLESVARNQEHDPLVWVDPAVLAGSLERRDGR